MLPVRIPCAVHPGQCDPVGNRQVYTDTSSLGGGIFIDYEYDSADRLVEVEGVTYTWDNGGNLASNGTLTYSYNTANQLVSVQGASTAITYTYNGDGLLYQRITPTGISTNTWDLASDLPQLLSDGQNTSRHRLL